MGFFKIIIFTFLLPHFAFSQSIEQEIRARFDQPERVQWLRYYKGRLDDFNDIAVILAHDGRRCKGQLTYVRSQTTFKLEGSIFGQFFTLYELDSMNNVSGTLKGKIAGNTIKAEWNNYDNSIGGEVLLTETKEAVDLPVHCGDNKWISMYVGKGGGLTMEMILQKKADNRLSGIVYVDGKSYDLKGEIDTDNVLHVFLKKYIEKNYGKLTGNFKNPNFFRANLIVENGQSTTLTFKLKDRLRTGCVEYADYVTSYDITYPKTKNAAFNEWMQSSIAEWTEHCRAFAQKANAIPPTPESRASERAFGWCDLDVYSNDLISGLLTFTATWEKTKRGLAFNFDPKEGRLLTRDDIFKSHFDQNLFIKSVAKTVFKNHPLYEDDGFRNWIEKDAAFPHFIIRKDGINFSTDFNVLYGRQSVTIPFEELTPFLKMEGILKKVID